MPSRVTLIGHSRWDYDFDALKTGLRAEGLAIAKDARRLVARRAVSAPGEFPGMQTGRLRKTLRVKMMSGGLSVTITHQIPGGMDRYPFMLAYGVKKNNRGATVAPRADHIEAALNNRRAAVVAMLRASLRKSIKPGGHSRETL